MPVTRPIVRIFFLGLIVVLTQATMLPEAYPGRSAKAWNKDFETSLSNWLEANTVEKSPTELTQDEFRKLLKGKDKVTSDFLQLRYADAQQIGEEAALKQAISTIASPEAKITEHPLFVYLLEEVIESISADTELNGTLNQQLLKLPTNSCPQKEALLRSINDTQQTEDGIWSVGDYVDRIQSYRSGRFKEEALDALASSIAVEERDSYQDILSEASEPYEAVFENHSWLNSSSKVTDSGALTVFSDEINAMTKKRRCRSAERHLKKFVDQGNLDFEFDQMEEVLEPIDKCFRRKTVKQRTKFWRNVEAWLKPQFGFKAFELSKRKLGAIEWAFDQFDKAEDAFQSILKEAPKSASWARENAIYMLARIAENKGDITASIGLYEKHITDFQASEKRDEVLRNLVLLSAIDGNPERGLKYASIVIDAEDQKPVDDRGSGIHSFALFWSGRLNLILGEPKIAKKLWRRASTEYYSTFYGAMGHYMHEVLSEEQFALEPSRTSIFQVRDVVKGVRATDQLQVDRILSLLKLGLQDEAACEISEMKTFDEHPGNRLAKAMFLYASGEWLEAIKMYDRLPRSYRSALPLGFERLLFPKAYQNLVDAYSEKLKVDPDLVFAIIRQESVFNPRARSGAGARGLMQMMPATARYEAKRLKRRYLDPQSKRHLKKLRRNRNALFEPELNVALGVHHVHRLLKRYENPIFVLTSYNANPTATKRWSKSIPTDDFLVFVERIPYQETRLYVKLVLRNYFYYKRWYRGEKQKLPHLDSLLATDIALVKKKAKAKLN